MRHREDKVDKGELKLTCSSPNSKHFPEVTIRYWNTESHEVYLTWICDVRDGLRDRGWNCTLTESIPHEVDLG